MEDIAQFEWDVGNLPFIYKHLNSPDNENGIPNFLPFKLSINPNTGLLMQVPNPATEAALDKAYRSGSMISGLMDNEGIGKEYAEDFLDFVCHTTGKVNFKGTNILEIGCGTGYLLSRLKKLGAEVLGIEPGKHGIEGGKKFGIPILNDFFPPKTNLEKFDLIIMYDLLEHIPDPESMLIKVRNILKENGKILIALADEQPYFEKGDISCLFHEHYGYFTDETLSNTVRASGFKCDFLKKASFSTLLYLLASEEKSKTDPLLNSQQAYKRAIDYKNSAILANNNFKKLLSKTKEQNQTLGIFVPQRALNVLTLINIDLPPIRFFDDNPVLHNTYFPGFPYKVENSKELVQSPPDRLIIFSKSFGDQIISKLKPQLPKKTVFHPWDEIFG